MYLSILKKAVPIPKLTNFDRFLFVGPHPDDIEVSCGGTVARLTSLGKTVTFAIVTDGSVGSIDNSLSSDEIVKIRKNESLDSAKLLGVQDVRFLNYVDGGDYTVDSVSKNLTEIILEVKPQAVFCPDYTVRSECHPDHLKAGQAATKAVFYSSWDKLTERFNLQGSVKDIVIAYYYTSNPNAYVSVTKTSKTHIEAISVHKSQFAENDIRSFKLYFNMRERRFGTRCGKLRAEGFRVLASTHQHCFPEADEF